MVLDGQRGSGWSEGGWGGGGMVSIDLMEPKFLPY
jgi:hypothetical protein